MLGGMGYPEKSAVLVIGPPVINKEALGYWFTRAGLQEGDFCVHVTRLSVREVQEDERAFGIMESSGSMVYLARAGGQAKLDLDNLAGVLGQIKEFLGQRSARRARIFTDILSPVLVLYPPETAYRFVSKLIDVVKQNEATLLATLEEGMHPSQTQVAMQQLFDGVVELSLFKEGLKVLPLFRIGKMRGANPDQNYYTISFVPAGVRFSRAFSDLPPSGILLERTESRRERAAPFAPGTELGKVFDYLLKSFVDDYAANKLPVEQSGWKTRTTIETATGVARASFYGVSGRFGPVVKELISSGLVEARFFPGQRGRGGEIIKLRIAYEKELVKRLVDARRADSGRAETND
jgi:KaiC/GvpD/RAD55 family RecA-like ATPase